MRPVLVAVMSACLAAIQPASGQVVTAINACRVDSAGTVVLSGRTILPEGTALTISALSREATAFVHGNGTFASASFGDSGEPTPAASASVRIVSHFTRELQPYSVLSRTGVGGSKFARYEHQLVPDDSTAPGAARHLDVTVPVAIPPFAPIAKPATITQLFILPMPVPDVDRGYRMTATFAVDIMGNGTLVGWNRPIDESWGNKAMKTLFGYRFRPALHADGTPACSLAVIRAAVTK